MAEFVPRLNLINVLRDKFSNSSDKIKFGVCGMDKKVKSKPMRNLIDRLDKSIFEIVNFGDNVLLSEPVENWPECDVLFAFYSDGFPLDKAISYSNLRQPLLINDLKAVYKTLIDGGIPTPFHVVVNRDEKGNLLNNEFKENENSIIVDGIEISKPFVEKPVDADDHNIYIYYPRSAGGGCKRLFRKVGDQSSMFDPNLNEVRKDGSYIYEEFLVADGTDIKVYSVGSNYAHAEARKSPVINGKVIRNKDTGKEVRFPILLNAEEKEIARKVSTVFHQSLLGFDMLRVNTKSYVCDVNGTSFVKSSLKYFDDTARLLKIMILKELAPQRLTPMDYSYNSSSSSHSNNNRFIPLIQKSPYSPRNSDLSNSSLLSPKSTTNKLRCVIGICKHGDRTPKQKLKVVINIPEILEFIDKYGNGDIHKEVTLKSTRQLEELLNVTTEILKKNEKSHSLTSSLESTDSNSNNNNKSISITVIKALQQMKHVLKLGSGLKGFNRKVQIRPISWKKISTEISTDHSSESDLESNLENIGNINYNNFNSTNSGTYSSCGDINEELAEIRFLMTENCDEMNDSNEINNEEEIVIQPQEEEKEEGEGEKEMKGEVKNKKNKDIVKGRSKSVDTSNSFNRFNEENKVMEDYRYKIEKRYYVEDVTRLTNHCPVHYRSREPSRKFSSGDEDEINGINGNNNNGEKEKEIVTEALLIVKWGGILTQDGREQSEELGEYIRQTMYEGIEGDEGMGLLRLHSSYRHDLKIYSSEEGRVRTTAAAFAKGFLHLESEHLTPIMVSLVRSHLESNILLDDTSNADFLMKDIRRELFNLLNVNKELEEDDIKRIIPTMNEILMNKVKSIKNPLQFCRDIYKLMEFIISELENIENKKIIYYDNETISIIIRRWKRLKTIFYNDDIDYYDLSKIPDIFENVKYEILHNHSIISEKMKELYYKCRIYTEIINNQEYGLTASEKWKCGTLILKSFLKKLKLDLMRSVSPEDDPNPLYRSNSCSRNKNNNNNKNKYNNNNNNIFYTNISSCRSDNSLTVVESPCIDSDYLSTDTSKLHTRLYFTSESHIHSLLNILLYSEKKNILSEEGIKLLNESMESDNLSHMVIRLLEDTTCEDNDEKKYPVEILYSRGVLMKDANMTMNDITCDEMHLISKENLYLKELLELVNDATKNSK